MAIRACQLADSAVGALPTWPNVQYRQTVQTLCMHSETTSSADVVGVADVGATKTHLQYSSKRWDPHEPTTLNRLFNFTSVHREIPCKFPVCIKSIPTDWFVVSAAVMDDDHMLEEHTYFVHGFMYATCLDAAPQQPAKNADELHQRLELVAKQLRRLLSQRAQVSLHLV